MTIALVILTFVLATAALLMVVGALIQAQQMSEDDR